MRVKRQSRARWAAIAVAVGCAGLAGFQLALAAGAPLGDAAWGGTETILSSGLRVGSAFAVLLYAVGAFAVLRCAGSDIGWIPVRFARVATWVFGGILLLSGLANLASESSWERYLFAPVGVALGALCAMVGRDGNARVDDPLAAAPTAPASRG